MLFLLLPYHRQSYYFFSRQKQCFIILTPPTLASLLILILLHVGPTLGVGRSNVSYSGTSDHHVLLHQIKFPHNYLVPRFLSIWISVPSKPSSPHLLPPCNLDRFLIFLLLLRGRITLASLHLGKCSYGTNLCAWLSLLHVSRTPSPDCHPL